MALLAVITHNTCKDLFVEGLTFPHRIFLSQGELPKGFQQCSGSVFWLSAMPEETP
jgi:hypothetical protein